MTTNDRIKTVSTTSVRTGCLEQQKQPSLDCLSADKKAHTAQQRDTSRSSPKGSCGMCRADRALTPLPTPASDSCLHDSSRVADFPLAVPLSPSAHEQFKTIAQAIADPSRFYHPALAVTSWCKLKALHGHPISDQRLERLGVHVDSIDRSTIEQAAREQRVRDRARKHAAQRGYDGPSPLICPDAIA